MAEENIVEANTYKEVEDLPNKEASLQEARELVQEPPKFDPVATAAQIFQTYFPIYCKQLDKLSRKQILRLNKAVIGLPLEEGFKPNLKNEEEMQAYFVLERLFQAKMVLFQATLQNRQEAQEKRMAEESLKTEELKGETDEVTSGS